MMNLWIVMGQSGEYDDICFWPVAAYNNEAEAQAHAERAREWYERGVKALPPHEHVRPARTFTPYEEMSEAEQRCHKGLCAHPGTNPFDSRGIPGRDDTEALMRAPQVYKGDKASFKGLSGDWYYVHGPISLVNKPC